jgi:hypothetical protein
MIHSCLTEHKVLKLREAERGLPALFAFPSLPRPSQEHQWFRQSPLTVSTSTFLYLGFGKEDASPNGVVNFLDRPLFSFLSCFFGL